MNPCRSAAILWLAVVAGAGVLSAARGLALADPAVPPPAPPGMGAVPPPNDDLLGTVEVNASAEGLPPLPKMAIVPVVPTGTADSVVNVVVRRDMELSGQFEMLPAETAPAGTYAHATALDLGAWRATGAEYVVRVFAQPAPNDSIRTELVGEAFLTPSKARAPADSPAPEARPAFRASVPTETTEVRAASHRLVDQLLGALTGRPGGFASVMTYAEKVGRWRRIFALDADGFDLHPVGPGDATALSPAFGPGGQVFYALSADYAPFRVVFGPNATPVPMNVPGSILGLAFSQDHSRMALTVMDAGRSVLWTGERGRVTPIDSAPFANHPVFGPLGKLAYVGGSPVQRVIINGKFVSPPGFMASAPVFCDTPQGLLIIYTVGVGSGADIISTDTNGGSLRRLTQHEGANTYAACSPDGRLIAFFSTGKQQRHAAGGNDEGAGLFVMPILRPWLAKKISNEVGESLRWEALPAAAQAPTATR
ncbi:MAG: tolB protein [Polyangiaceae bacterium]|nr:tolB protein [Polyangiaceae bacterium]